MTISAMLVSAVAASVSVGHTAPAKGVVANVVENLEPSVDQLESVVVSLATNPMEDPEAACVALQIGMNLFMNDLDEDGEADSIPADEMTLFVTLDGVYLVDPNPRIQNHLKTTECLTPRGRKSLANVLYGFVEVAGGHVVVCPLCWSQRGNKGTPPTYGSVADAFLIHGLFLYRDKVLVSDHRAFPILVIGIDKNGRHNRHRDNPTQNHPVTAAWAFSWRLPGIASSAEARIAHV
jgi:hypothetical protein